MNVLPYSRPGDDERGVEHSVYPFPRPALPPRPDMMDLAHAEADRDAAIFERDMALIELRGEREKNAARIANGPRWAWYVLWMLAGGLAVLLARWVGL